MARSRAFSIMAPTLWNSLPLFHKFPSTFMNHALFKSFPVGPKNFSLYSRAVLPTLPSIACQECGPHPDCMWTFCMMSSPSGKQECPGQSCCLPGIPEGWMKIFLSRCDCPLDGEDIIWWLHGNKDSTHQANGSSWRRPFSCNREDRDHYLVIQRIGIIELHRYPYN